MIRSYRDGDATDIGEVFFEAVHRLAAGAYSAEERHAWAPERRPPDFWVERCERKQPFVWEEQGRVRGFLELDPNGHIDCTYVHPSVANRGVGSALLEAAIERARELGLSRLWVEVSINARPFFEKHGFRVLRPNCVERAGVFLHNFVMERDV